MGGTLWERRDAYVLTARRPYLLMPRLEIGVRLADEKCRHAGSIMS
jgi:hypothetical protein